MVHGFRYTLGALFFFFLPLLLPSFSFFLSLKIHLMTIFGAPKNDWHWGEIKKLIKHANYPQAAHSLLDK